MKSDYNPYSDSAAVQEVAEAVHSPGVSWAAVCRPIAAEQVVDPMAGAVGVVRGAEKRIADVLAERQGYIGCALQGYIAMTVSLAVGVEGIADNSHVVVVETGCSRLTIDHNSAEVTCNSAGLGLL